jgi:hypothetical protein
VSENAFSSSGGVCCCYLHWFVIAVKFVVGSAWLMFRVLLGGLIEALSLSIEPNRSLRFPNSLWC